MWLLTLLFLSIQYSNTQTTPTYLRKTTISNKYMQTVTLCYYRVVNQDYYSSWTTNTNTYFSDRTKYNLQFQRTASINSITSGATTYGYEIVVGVVSIWDTGFTLAISATSVTNRYLDSLVWFSVRIFIFLLPMQIPFVTITTRRQLYTTIGDNLYVPTVQTYTYQFIISRKFYLYCFYDSAKTIKDKIHLLPSLVQLNVQNPVYLNLTSQSNWVYDWNNSTTSLYFDLSISAYNSQALYAVMDVMGICPNSYTYTQSNLSMAVSIKNWFSMQPTNSQTNKYRSVMLQYPFSNDSAVMMGMSITGLSIYSRDFYNITATAGTSLLIVSFNITQGYDDDGTYTGYMGNLSYNIVNPQNCYGFYWMYGTIGSCPNNLIEYNTTHCICPDGTTFSYTSGKCLNCTLLFGSNCSSCSSTKCLGCITGLYLYQTSNKSLCLNCMLLYGQKCSQCSDSTCLKCNNNYTINTTNQCECHFFDNFIDYITGDCLSCPLKFQFCVNCTYNGCFGCLDKFTLSNNTCTCFLPNILKLGSCFSCFDLFGLGCILCNSSNCINCDNNFQLVNNTCKCQGQGIALFKTTCLKCSQLFGIGCLGCNLTSCTNCDYNFQLNSTNCTCPQPTYTLSMNKCNRCSDIFLYCLECSNATCNRCYNNFKYANGSCSCDGDRYLTLGGGCQLCNNVHQNCILCNRSACLSCTINFTLQNATCICKPPLVYWQSQCLKCSDLSDPTLCNSIQVQLQHYQSGTNLYFWLKYSTQVTFTSPIQFNIDVTLNHTPINYNYQPQTGIFSIDLSQLSYISNITVQIRNQQQIIAYHRQLIYTPVTFTAIPVVITNTFRQFINYIAAIRNYAIMVGLLLCLGVFHKLSRSLSIVIILWLSQSNMANSMGILNDIFNHDTPIYAIDVHLGWNLNRIKCNSLRYVVYGLNKSIIDQSIQLYTIAIASILMVAYVIGYLKTKPKAKRYLAWRNILTHGIEYLLQNVLNLHGLLCLPAMLQLKLIVSMGSAAMVEHIADLLFACYLLLLPCLLVGVCLVKYKTEPLSVVYNGLGRNKLSIICWLLTTIQPYLICMASLFISSPINLYLIISVNVLSLVVQLLCMGIVRNKLDYLLALLKQICIVFISISILFNGQDWILLKIACWCSVVICLTEFLQITYKSVMLLLVNKGLVDHSISSSAKIANQYSDQHSSQPILNHKVE